MKPWPLHLGQAPLLLKLKRAGSAPVSAANSLRMASKMPVKVRGLALDDRPMGLWSMTVAWGCWGRKHSWMSELLPLPDTPVTQVSMPLGMRTVMFLRLLAVAFRIS